MNDCQCGGPGYCVTRGIEVTAMGHRICSSGNERSIAAYFKSGPTLPRPATPREVAPVRGKIECVYLGPAVTGPDGRAMMRDCETCRGNVRLKVFACNHPGHGADPTTDDKACRRCRDYTTKLTEVDDMKTPMDMGTMPVPMVVPSMKRPGIFRGGVLQVMVTRACDLSCHGCTAGSNLVSKPAVMTPDQFEEAVLSLRGYWGVIGCFGGNPTTSRYFEDYCRILRSHVPFEQRGIWTNNLLGKGALCRITFDPKVSNINVHTSQEAYDEFAREWPEAIEARKGHVDRGLNDDAIHGSPYISPKDLESLPHPDGTSRENTEENRWQLIKDCTINKHWSAMICLVGGELRAFACEIMGHMASLHADNPNWDETGLPIPDLGLAVEPGWWRKPLADFEGQFRTFCHNCAVPLNRPGQLAIGGGREEFSERHRFIARPKVRDRPVEFVSVESLGRRDRPATEYLDKVTPGYARP